MRNGLKRLQTGWRSLWDIWFREGTLVRGRYRVLRSLGGGSYGVAYLCRDVTTDRPCVLKRVHPLQGGAARARAVYRRETAILTRLQHPSIPELYEVFRHRGQLCFTMEAADGKSIEQLLFHEGVSFPEKEALEVLSALLPVVAYIHSLGIVHRDIHISNIILGSRKGESLPIGAVKLIDFGLARLLSDSQAPETDDAEESHQSAPRPHDPPDRALRRRIAVDSDFYGMGHLLLFLLYSTFPDSTESSAPLSWEEELHLHPNTKKLLRRMLQTEQPYSNCNELATDLNQAIAALTDVD